MTDRQSRIERIERIERQNEAMDAFIARGVFVLSAFLTACALDAWVL